MTETKAYQCDHCSKTTRTKGSMVVHEKQCWKNDDNKHACFDSCKNLIKEIISTENGNVTTYTCDVTKAKMYSYKVQYKKQVDKTGMVRMPSECDKYESNKQKPNLICAI